MASNIETVVGSVLVGAGFALTFHSILRIYVLQTAGSRMFLFSVTNGAQFLNEIAVLLMLLSSTDQLDNWANFLNNFSYFISKPIILYLAFLRCRSAFPPYRNYPGIHYLLIAFRAIELLVIWIASIYVNVRCNGRYVDVCESFSVILTMQNALAPAFRFYYIISEGIFYVKLFRTLNTVRSSESLDSIRQRRYQTYIFTLDMIVLISMSVYRLLILVYKNWPTFIYMELFSCALTIFVITEFGLTLPKMFKASKEDTSTSNNGINIVQTTHTFVESSRINQTTPYDGNDNSMRKIGQYQQSSFDSMDLESLTIHRDEASEKSGSEAPLH
ncbi:16315_t:CDS:1 [Acaulospora morrowiae]|uniref:16315_t:CDS:1 n=1 Tax=Acaulospora morrowiae TaxID=94023 RepID=A0A9N9GQ09_9GLOM|nr:16315_t:CDS:1 [Acaulospora morrowiae]